MVKFDDSWKNKKVFLDTAPLIYFMEQHPFYQPFLNGFFTAHQQGTFILLTSTITLLETMVHPLRVGRKDLADQYENILLSTPGLTLLSLSPDISKKAAAMRAEYRIKTPDAIQLASAVYSQCDIFLTNDKDLKKVKGIPIFCLSEYIQRELE